MPLPYDKPWKELSNPERIERLHKELRALSDFYASEALNRNKRRALLEEALKQIEIRVEKLEKPEGQKKT